MDKKANEVSALKMTWPTVASGVLVAALILGGIMSVFFPLKAEAEEVYEVPVEVPVEVPQTAPIVAEVMDDEETREEKFLKMFQAAPKGDVIVITASDKPFTCGIVITGENGWSFDRLIDLAVRYGCTVTYDNTPVKPVIAATPDIPVSS